MQFGLDVVEVVCGLHAEIADPADELVVVETAGWIEVFNDVRDLRFNDGFFLDC